MATCYSCGRHIRHELAGQRCGPCLEGQILERQNVAAWSRRMQAATAIGDRVFAAERRADVTRRPVGHPTSATKARVFHTYGDSCYLCGGAATTVDHLRPRSRGGSNHIENLRPACLPCNNGRGNTMREEVLRAAGLTVWPPQRKDWHPTPEFAAA